MNINSKGITNYYEELQQASPSTHTTHHTRKANSKMSVTPLGTLAGLPWLVTGNREGRRMASRGCHKQYVIYNYGDYYGFMANYIFHKSDNQLTKPTLTNTRQAANTYCMRMGTEAPHDSKCATMWSRKLPM